jgi:hypothetical protein
MSRQQAAGWCPGAVCRGLLAERFSASPRNQHIVSSVHAAGPRPTAELMLEMLEAAGADPTVLNRLEDWAQLNPETVRRLGADRRPHAPSPVPKEERR